MVSIGVDALTRTHHAGAADEHGRSLGTPEGGACSPELERFIAWSQESAGPRLIAIEGGGLWPAPEPVVPRPRRGRRRCPDAPDRRRPTVQPQPRRGRSERRDHDCQDRPARAQPPQTPGVPPRGRPRAPRRRPRPDQRRGNPRPRLSTLAPDRVGTGVPDREPRRSATVAAFRRQGASRDRRERRTHPSADRPGRHSQAPPEVEASELEAEIRSLTEASEPSHLLAVSGACRSWWPRSWVRPTTSGASRRPPRTLGPLRCPRQAARSTGTA
jgi:hypothetical protein